MNGLLNTSKQDSAQQSKASKGYLGRGVWPTKVGKSSKQRESSMTDWQHARRPGLGQWCQEFKSESYTGNEESTGLWDRRHVRGEGKGQKSLVHCLWWKELAGGEIHLRQFRILEMEQISALWQIKRAAWRLGGSQQTD